MDLGDFPSAEEVTAEAQKRLEPTRYRISQWFGRLWYSIGNQINRFSHPLLIFVVAGLLILVLTSGDLSNLKPVVGLLIFCGIVWAIFTAFSSKADERLSARQEPETAETWEDDE